MPRTTSVSRWICPTSRFSASRRSGAVSGLAASCFSRSTTSPTTPPGEVPTVRSPVSLSRFWRLCSMIAGGQRSSVPVCAKMPLPIATTLTPNENVMVSTWMFTSSPSIPNVWSPFCASNAANWCFVKSPSRLDGRIWRSSVVSAVVRLRFTCTSLLCGLGSPLGRSPGWLFSLARARNFSFDTMAAVTTSRAATLARRASLVAVLDLVGIQYAVADRLGDADRLILAGLGVVLHPEELAHQHVARMQLLGSVVGTDAPRAPRSSRRHRGRCCWQG